MSTRVEANGIAFPLPLANSENDLLAERRKASSASEGGGPAHVVGFGLSGGGIRSATFSLGLFQGLARLGLARHIDYLSTVSGGGYFGSFFATLFTRQAVAGPTDAEDILLQRKNPEILRNLRENGRYLAPNGAGDLLLGGAVVLRNWVAIQIVLVTLLLTAFLGLQLLTVALAMPGWPLLQHLSNPTVAFSPWLLVAAGVFAIAAFPPGWAYWMVGKHRLPHPWFGLALVLAIGLWPLRHGIPPTADWASPSGLGLLLATVALLTALSWLVAKWRASHLTGRTAALAQRNLLSRALKVGLVATGVVAALALIDTLALTFWARLSGRGLAATGAGLGGTLLAFAAVTKRIAIFASDRRSGESRLKLPAAILAAAGAVILMVTVLVAVDLLALAIRWDLGRSADPPRLLEPAPPLSTGRHRSSCCRDEHAARRPLPVDAATTAVEAQQATGEPVGRRLGLAFLVGGLASLLFGQTRAFLNLSSQHALYSARLSRAYLGASNPDRTAGQSLSEVVASDEPPLATYWSEATAEKGAPLHLLNVTVNETVSGETGLQQQDRKGVGMALGPAGISVGVRHHLSLDWARVPEGAEPVERGVWKVFRGPFRAFEKLSLGEWVGLSGAAFSTGAGYRTSFGLSFLAGFANVRLGHWWNPDNDPKGRHSLPEWLAARVFPVQLHLLNEFLARFPGTSGRWWYLSDGGHFENMGGYELIRRRLARLVIVDAECDASYRFEGLANLVRKSRVDLDTEIDFWDRLKLETWAKQNGADLKRLGLGTLEDLKRSRPDEDSLAHAAIADVRYLDESGNPASEGLLLYVKPTLTGREPVDVKQYHSENPQFPQQTTADQFFDEAQWESYRKLGEHIATEVFGGGAPRGAGTAGKNPLATLIFT